MTKTATHILVLNSGSSSLKFGLFGSGRADEELLLKGSAEGIGREDGTMRIREADGTVLLDQQHVLETQQEALEKLSVVLRAHAEDVCAIGHRVVHGGPHLVEHQQITPEVVATLETSVHFAPLHIPQALRLITQAMEAFPSVPHFACFDTAFHRSLPDVASHFPLPNRYFEQGVRRYGFHGLSYESLIYRLGDGLPSRAVFAHLGNGSSLAAIRNGVSIDTTMGMTPTGGVMMGSRSGNLDPGLCLYLSRIECMNSDQMEYFFNHQCGLAGLSGGETDMQALLAREAVGDRSAILATTAYCTEVSKTIGAYAALLGGIDLLVFTGGIGMHSEEIRRRICDPLEFLGLAKRNGPMGRILALKTEEEMQIARHVRRLMD